MQKLYYAISHSKPQNRSTAKSAKDAKNLIRTLCVLCGFYL